MQPSGDFTKLFLRGIAWDAGEFGRSLVELLEICSRGQLVDSPRGEVFAATTSDGTATLMFGLPPRGGLRSREIAKLAGELHQRAVAILATHPGISDSGLVFLLTERSRGTKSGVKGAGRNITAAGLRSE